MKSNIAILCVQPRNQVLLKEVRIH